MADCERGQEAWGEEWAQQDRAPQPWRGPQIKLEKFGGSRSEYRNWRDEVQAILKFQSGPQHKQVLLVYMALESGKGRPRDLFSSLDIDEVGGTEPVEV